MTQSVDHRHDLMNAGAGTGDLLDAIEAAEEAGLGDLVDECLTLREKFREKSLKGKPLRRWRPLYDRYQPLSELLEPVRKEE